MRTIIDLLKPDNWFETIFCSVSMVALAAVAIAEEIRKWKTRR